MIIQKVKLLALASIFTIGVNASSQTRKIHFQTVIYSGLSTGIFSNDNNFQGTKSLDLAYGLDLKLSKSINDYFALNFGIGFDQFGDKSNFRGDDWYNLIFGEHRYRTTFYSLNVPIDISFQIHSVIRLNFGLLGSYIFQDRLDIMFDIGETGFMPFGTAKRENLFDIRPRVGFTILKGISDAKTLLFGLDYRIGLIENASNVPVFFKKLPWSFNSKKEI